MTEGEMKAEIEQVTQQVQKIGGETDSLKGEVATLNQKVQDLEAQLANETLSDETQAAWNALKEQVNVVDAKVGDLGELTHK
jgi:prefoldin subunit 5